MDIIVGIIIVIAIIKYWENMLRGLGYAFMFGLIGAIFGDTGATIGMILGFFIGISPQDEDEEEGEQSTRESRGSTKTSHKSGSFKKTDSQIIRCPSCKKKIKVKLPLRAKIAKCVACSSSFSLIMDKNGNVKAENVSTDSRTEANTNYGTSVSDYFKILGVESTATPQEVRMAYKRKIREYHPDRVEGLGDKLKETADEESKAINIAYTALKAKGLSR